MTGNKKNSEKVQGKKPERRAKKFLEDQQGHGNKKVLEKKFGLKRPGNS